MDSTGVKTLRHQVATAAVVIIIIIITIDPPPHATPQKKRAAMPIIQPDTLHNSSPHPSYVLFKSNVIATTPTLTLVALGSLAGGGGQGGGVPLRELSKRAAAAAATFGGALWRSSLSCYLLACLPLVSFSSNGCRARARARHHHGPALSLKPRVPFSSHAHVRITASYHSRKQHTREEKSHTCQDFTVPAPKFK